MAKTEVVKEKYVLKEGVGNHMDHDAGPGEMRILKAGDIVELTPNQAKHFGDKFKPMAQVLAESETARRTAEIADTLSRSADKKAKQEQKRLKEEALNDLASERVKLAEESKNEEGDDETEKDDTTGDDTGEDEGDAEEGTKKSESDSSSAKDADPKAGTTVAAAPKRTSGTNQPGQVKTVAAKKAS